MPMTNNSIAHKKLKNFKLVGPIFFSDVTYIEKFKFVNLFINSYKRIFLDFWVLSSFSNPIHVSPGLSIIILAVISQTYKFRTELIIKLTDWINLNFLTLVFSESFQNNVSMSITLAPYVGYFFTFFLSNMELNRRL